MVGELIQSGLDELRDPNDASDPLTTVGRFVGIGIEMEAWGEMLEIAGDMDGGVGGILPEVEPQPQLAQNLDTSIDPMMAKGPSFGSPFS
ncbi:MAG: hypothetical protein JKY71_07990 [Alphaproteobacteria bacterium]|nr:hypothetical protein [Alphaproteobacteria bacterium]